VSAASLSLIVKSPLGTIHMDINTIRNLELVRNIRSGDWKHSLMGYMNHCKTAMGSRLLRASILQPMQSGSNAEKLNARLDVSGFLIVQL
jgi:DNA mismatch repair ATPase MutS